MKRSDWSTLRLAFLGFFALSLLFLIAFSALYFEVLVVEGVVTDASAVEYLQELLLLLTAGMFWHLAIVKPEQRGALYLIAGFFSCLLIRELDGLLDLISRGFWKYPAWLVAVSCIFVAWRTKQVARAMAEYCRHPSFGAMLLSVGLLLVYSRLFGYGGLWTTMMGDEYIRGVKNLVEEGAELGAYCGSFFAAGWYYVSCRVAD